MNAKRDDSGNSAAGQGPAGKNPASEQEAYLAALKLIAQRDRTVHQMRTRLAEKGFLPTAIDGAIERLRRIGYLDDLTYARRTIADVLATRPAGPRYITERLRLKGVHPDVVREALAETYPDERVEEMAYRAAAKRVRRLRRDDPVARRRKLAGFLSRRGFSYGDVQKALHRALGELEGNDAE